MKKFLCYVAIVLLVLLIAIPPLTRIFYKEKEVEEVVRDTYTLVTCTKDLYVISESYINDEPLSIKFTRPIEDESINVNTENNSVEFTLDNELKNIVNSTTSSEKQELSYVLQYQNYDSSELNGLSNYQLPLDSQIEFYEQNGYICKKMVQ